VGRSEMLNYSLYLSDNLFSLSIIRTQLQNDEKMFLDYYTNLLKEDTVTRIGMGGLYETTCLLMADQKTSSSTMPIIDNLVESITVSSRLTEKIVKACLRSSPGTCIKMSSLGKTLFLASTDPSQGINRYTQRTNRDNAVNQNTIRRLRSLFRQKVITSYIRKHGRVPSLINVPEDLSAQLEMKAAGGNYLNNIISEVSRYDGVRLGKFLDPGKEMNLQSRIIDKACTKDTYNSGDNSEKEITYYIEHNMEEVFKEPVGIVKEKYRSSPRKSGVLHRDDEVFHQTRQYLTVRLSEKEKEQKTAARFYGIASFKLKLWISSIMEMIKRAMKLLPGQMMTMTDDERREIMYKMSEKLLEPNSYSLFLDYSGHNTSQRPENTNFLLEEIANMYGYYAESQEYEEFTSLSYVFSNITIIAEDKWSDFVYYSNGQLGAIEGWLGGLWGIQSQLMLEDMFMQLGVKDYIGTTYSDDSCGVFTQEDLDVSKLNGIVKNVQQYGEDMGLIVKLSQTQVTNGRCSMLKEHYYKGVPIEMNLKKMMSISPNGPKILFDDNESANFIDSGYTSSCTRSSEIICQTLLRNLRAIKLLSGTIRKYIESMAGDLLDKRYLASEHNYEITIKTAIRGITNEKSVLIPSPRSRNIEFYQFNKDSSLVLDLSLIILYGPYTTFGFAMTPMPDVLISGYSLSNVKRVSYLQGVLSKQSNLILGRLINLSDSPYAYIDNPFPFTGGRRDTSLLVKEAIGKKLPTIIKNKELLSLMTLYSTESEKSFKRSLIMTFSNCFSSRIVSKFYECSLYSYVNEVLSKIDNAATMKRLLGGRKMMSIINSAWTSNYKRKIIMNEKSILTYDELLYRRKRKNMVFDKYSPNPETVELNFIRIEEIPIMGKVFHSDDRSMMQPIFKGKTKLTEKGKKNHPPQKTFFNMAKFDRELGVDGMFEHKLIFKAYDLVRYVKWLMMEQEKFSVKMKQIDEERLILACNETLSTFTDARYKDIEEYVVCPKGGRYFHRALTGGFNPKTGDLSSNVNSCSYDLTGIDQLLNQTGGTDNNLNVQYLLIYIRICLSLLEPEPWKLVSLSLSNDICFNIRDVTFRLEGLGEMVTSSQLCNVTSKEKIKSRGKMYYNYSTYIEKDDDIEGKFINHISTTRESFIEQENAFRAVHSYMTDQMIVSPELISDEILKHLAGEKNLIEGRHPFFDNFYRYYKSLNIIGNETPARSVIRGLLYDELFKVNENSKQRLLWTNEIVKHGYSSNFKESLMRLFILSTSLSYRIQENKSGMLKLITNQNRSLMNGKANFERMRKGNCQFYIKDKRITEMIVNSFPTLGYSYSDVHRAVVDLCFEVGQVEFEQVRLGSYYLESHQSFAEKKTDVNYGTVEYKELMIKPRDLIDNLGIESALKAFETACSLMVSPSKVSSPTLSAVYPSAKGLLSVLTANGFIGVNEKVIELCGGRGDFHLAMQERGINHTTLSREDGFNLAMRIPGMTSKKVSFNCFRQSDYISYFDHEIILIDVSHITEKTDCLSNLLGDAKIGKKKVILRLNGLNKFFNHEILKELSSSKINSYIPEIGSPGYVYLTIDFTANSGPEEEASLSKKGYTASLISSSLINVVSRVSLMGVIEVPPVKVQDQTMEVVSDNRLYEMLVEDDKEYVHVNVDLKEKIKNIDDFQDSLLVYVSTGMAIKYKEKIEFVTERLISKGDEDSMPHNLFELGKRIRKKEGPIIEVNGRLLKNRPDNIARGVKGMSSDELIEFIEDVISIPQNKKISIECWKVILTLSTNEVLVYSEKIVDIVNLQKFRKKLDRTINSSYEIASKAILSFKTGRIIEGLMCMANLENIKKKAILKHKDKTTRTNILHYKLYMNRIMLMSRSMNVEPYFFGVTNEEFEEMWLNISQEDEVIDLSELFTTGDDLDDLNSFFKRLSSEYFSFFDHFKSAIQDLTTKVERDTRLINDVEVNLIEFGMMGTEEDIARNEAMVTFDDVVDYVGEDDIFELWGEGDLADWGDEE
jgi:hypothetical protein